MAMVMAMAFSRKSLEALHKSGRRKTAVPGSGENLIEPESALNDASRALVQLPRVAGGGVSRWGRQV